MKKLLFIFALLTVAFPSFCAQTPGWKDIPATNSAGVVTFKAPTTQVITTNLLNEGQADLKGTLSLIPPGKYTFSLGTNTLYVHTNSHIKLLSPTNDVTLVTLRLNEGTNTGQLLYLVNASTNKGFTLPHNSLTLGPGNGHVYLNQGLNWTPSNNFEGIALLYESPDWIEIGRFSSSNGFGGVTINPTDNHLPRRIDATSFGDSQFVQRGTLTWLTNLNSIAESKLYFMRSNAAPVISVGAVTTGGELKSSGTVNLESAQNTSLSLSEGTNLIYLIAKAFYPNISNDLSLGTSIQPWKDLYLGTGSLHFIFPGNDVAYSDNGTTLTRNGVAVGGGGGIVPPWTNISGVLQPNGVGENTNAIQIFPDGYIRIGNNTPAGDAMYDAIDSYRNYDLGEGWNGLYLRSYSVTNPFTHELTWYADNNGQNFQLASSGNGSSRLQLIANTNDLDFRLYVDNEIRSRLWPTAPDDGTTPYTLDTSIAHTSGNLFEVENLDVDAFVVASTAIFPSDASYFFDGSGNWSKSLTNFDNIFVTNLTVHGKTTFITTNTVFQTNFYFNNTLITNIVQVAGGVSGTTNFINLSVQAAKLPQTNYPGIDAGNQNWELVYYRTNSEGSVSPLGSTWQFRVPRDYATNSLTVNLQSILLSTNGPNTSNTVFRASIFRATSGDSTDLHVGTFGTSLMATNTWTQSTSNTNKMQDLTIAIGANSLLQPGDFAILKVERVSTNDTYVGATSVVGLQLEYTRP